MSIAKVKYVKAARKDQGECDKCRTPLPAGSAYRHYTVGFRSKNKRRRCMDNKCTPKSSELESSKLASVYAAQEDAEAQVNDAETVDDLQDILNTLAEAVREVAEEYREASVNPNTGEVFNYDAEERAETLDGAADELESFDIPEIPESCPDCENGSNTCDECNGSGTDTRGEEDVECEDCEGTGDIDCVECGGTGDAPEEAAEDAREAVVTAINEMELP